MRAGLQTALKCTATAAATVTVAAAVFDIALLLAAAAVGSRDPQRQKRAEQYQD
ncbi:hypothetical protein GCM10027361_04940 [Erwinia aphidicola]